MKPLKLTAQFTKGNRLKDDSVSLTFVTAEEVTTDLFTQIDQYRKQSGYLLFKVNDFDPSEIPTDNARITGQISPSQYLRNCLFAKHMKTGGTKDTFPAYYEKVMARFAQKVNESYEG